MNVWRAPTFASQQSAEASTCLRPMRANSSLHDHGHSINRVSVYEQSLPGDSYIIANVERLQKGHYESEALREQIDSVAFIALSFVFHPSRSLNNRFRAATVKVSLRHHPEVHNYARPRSFLRGDDKSLSLSPHRKALGAPRFLQHAPHLIYGSPSDQTMQWYVGLAASLGATQLPVTASVNPSTNMQGSYKMSEMMRVQGSSRAYKSDRGVLDNGQIVWSLEENSLQKSGLPREFTFVMLIELTPGRKILMDIEVESEIANWMTRYPLWWSRWPKYRPLKVPIDLDHEVGEKFKSKYSHHDGDDDDDAEPPSFNFAELGGAFEDMVRMPGTTFYTNQPTGAATDKPAGEQASGGQSSSKSGNKPAAIQPPSSAVATIPQPQPPAPIAQALLPQAAPPQPQPPAYTQPPQAIPINIRVFVEPGSLARAMSPVRNGGPILPRPYPQYPQYPPAFSSREDLQDYHYPLPQPYHHHQQQQQQQYENGTISSPVRNGAPTNPRVRHRLPSPQPQQQQSQLPQQSTASAATSLPQRLVSPVKNGAPGSPRVPSGGSVQRRESQRNSRIEFFEDDEKY